MVCQLFFYKIARKGRKFHGGGELYTYEVYISTGRCERWILMLSCREEEKMATKRIEYMCSYCGKKELRFVSMGKPQPGKCPRKQGDKPHTWMVNRRLEN